MLSVQTFQNHELKNADYANLNIRAKHSWAACCQRDTRTGAYEPNWDTSRIARSRTGAYEPNWDTSRIAQCVKYPS